LTACHATLLYYPLQRIVRDEIQVPEFHYNNKERKTVPSVKSVPKLIKFTSDNVPHYTHRVWDILAKRS